MKKKRRKGKRVGVHLTFSREEGGGKSRPSLSSTGGSGLGGRGKEKWSDF